MERSHWATLQWRILLMLLKTKSYIIQGSYVARLVHHSRSQVGMRLLCRHNFRNNRKLLESGIMLK